MIKRFSNYIPVIIIQNILIEEELDLLIEEIVFHENFESLEIAIETYPSIEESHFPQEYNSDSAVVSLDGLNEKELNGPLVQAMFKRSRHNTTSIFIISQDYYELSKRTIRATGNIYHILKRNNFRDFQNLYQDKAGMDMTFNEFKFSTSSCWNEKYQPLTTDMTKEKYAGGYRSGLNFLFVPNNWSF